MSKPIPPDTLIFDLNPSRFLRPEDLLERWKVDSIAITICRLAWEETTPSAQDIDPQTRKPKVVDSPVLFFKTKSGKEFPRGILISAKENLNALKASTGAKTAGELIGKRITIFVSEHKKKQVLRVDPKPAPRETNVPDSPPAPEKAKAKAEPKPGAGEMPTAKLDEWRAQAEADVITAFTNLCNSAGIDQETKTAILRECGGDFDAAFDKVLDQYSEVLT